MRYLTLMLSRPYVGCMKRFDGTIKYLHGQKAAIITLTENGQWSGSSRIDLRVGSKSDLYEIGYDRLSASAAHKGGRLETYKVCTA